MSRGMLRIYRIEDSTLHYHFSFKMSSALELSGTQCQATQIESEFKFMFSNLAIS